MSGLPMKPSNKKNNKKKGRLLSIISALTFVRPSPWQRKLEEYEARKELEKLQKTESGKLSEEESSRLQILIKRFEDSDEYEKPKDITTDYAKFHRTNKDVTPHYLR